MDKVSVIVPVYGVEAYLPACVDSLLAQSYENLEILLVDDGSPDQCPGICDEYAEKDPRVRAFHKKNGGAASARNLGLDNATGAYVCFVDSDDTLEPDYVKGLLETLGHGDAAVCAYTLLQPSGATPQKVEPPGEYAGQAYLALFLTSWCCALIWNKLFRREIIGNIRFQEGHRIDDEFFTYRLILNCRRVTVTQAPLYHYRLRRSSVMHDPAARQQMLLDRVEYLSRRLEHVAAAAPALEQDFLEDLLDSFARFRRGCRNMPPVKNAIRRWVRQNLPRILTLQRPWKRRCVLLWQLLRPTGTAAIHDGITPSREDYFP